jgi:hypothetical protein
MLSFCVCGPRRGSHERTLITKNDTECSAPNFAPSVRLAVFLANKWPSFATPLCFERWVNVHVRLRELTESVADLVQHLRERIRKLKE